MKVLCINKRLFSKEVIDLLKKKFYLDFANNCNNINKYDILLIRPDSYLVGKISKKTKIKYIISVSTGLNHIDLNIIKKYNIKLFYLKNKYFLNSVKATSEHTIFLLLSALRKIKRLFKNPDFQSKHVSNEISRSKIGILGYGRVGKQVSQILNTFGADLYAYDVKKKALPKYIYECHSMQELFKRSKIILIHIPLNPLTHEIINKKNLKLLSNKIIINTSRAEVFEENILIEMIRSNKITYFTDVVHGEGSAFNLNKLAKLKTCDNLFITPHIAGITEESIKITDLYLINKFIDAISQKK